MIGDLYPDFHAYGIFGLRYSISPKKKFMLVRFDLYNLYAPVWAKLSKDNTEILGIIYGKD